MSQELIRKVTEAYMKNDVPEFRPGDNVKVHVKIVEGNRERIQIFEGAGISYTLDPSRVMFSQGNRGEKLRIRSLVRLLLRILTATRKSIIPIKPIRSTVQRF